LLDTDPFDFDGLGEHLTSQLFISLSDSLQKVENQMVVGSVIANPNDAPSWP